MSDTPPRKPTKNELVAALAQAETELLALIGADDGQKQSGDAVAAHVIGAAVQVEQVERHAPSPECPDHTASS